MTQKFTPGPWEYGREIEGPQKFIGCKVWNEKEKYHIAVLHSSEYGRAESETIANAQLISAAPDLLRELKSLLKAYEFLYSHTDPEGALAVHVEWVLDADKAIKKAEGE